MNDDNDGVVKCQKNSTTPPRCHLDQVDPLVFQDDSDAFAYAESRSCRACAVKLYESIGQAPPDVSDDAVATADHAETADLSRNQPPRKSSSSLVSDGTVYIDNFL